ncbi:MAG: family 20 glycosylhydrolase, partial [Victivallales bacterium]|nr:family 20 glycosylhydrolase [Victivallales bacterium]
PNIHPGKLKRLLHVIETLGALKYNTILIEFADNFPLHDNPFSLRKFTFSKRDIEKIMTTAKANGIELIPFLQVASHALWMTRHPEFAEMSEGKPDKPWDSNYCLSNQKAQKLVEKVITETADLIKPRYFFIPLDEILLCPFQVCPECSRKNPVDLLLGHVLPIQKLLFDRGITPIVAHDQFVKPGLGGDQLIPALDRLDHRTLVCAWQYENHPADKIFRKLTQRGFKVIYMSWVRLLENCMNLPRLAVKCGAKGCILTYWYWAPATLDKPTCELNVYPGTVYQADYSWNSSDVDFTELPFDPSRELKRLLDPDSVPQLKGKAVPWPIAANSVLGENPQFPKFSPGILGRIKRELADSPEKFNLTVSGGRCGAIVLSGGDTDNYESRVVSLPIATKANGIAFLMTAAPFNSFELASRLGVRPVIGQFTIVYTDGKKKVIPLKYRQNINEWNSLTGINDGRIVLRTDDANGAVFNLYSIDWSNPHPEKTIKEVIFSTNRQQDIAIALFAVSLFGAENQPSAAEYTGEATLPPGSGTRAKAPTIDYLVDFSSGGMNKVIIDSWGMTGPVQASVKEIPGHGQTLQLVVPPLSDAARKTSMPWKGRVTVDIPVPPDSDFETICFDFWCDRPEEIWRPDLYILGRQSGTANAFLNYYPYGFSAKTWYPIRMPVSALITKEGGGVKKGDCRSIRISFFFDETHTRTLTIRLTGIGISNDKIGFCAEIKRPEKRKNHGEIK